MSQTWAKCLDSLKDALPLGEFSVWVKPLQASERNETLYLNAPSASISAVYSGFSKLTAT